MPLYRDGVGGALCDGEGFAYGETCCEGAPCACGKAAAGWGERRGRFAAGIGKSGLLDGGPAMEEGGEPACGAAISEDFTLLMWQLS